MQSPAPGLFPPAKPQAARGHARLTAGRIGGLMFVRQRAKVFAAHGLRSATFACGRRLRMDAKKMPIFGPRPTENFSIFFPNCLTRPQPWLRWGAVALSFLPGENCSRI